ncbi:hypothetical protein [Kitasatospora sp. NPDC093558]|uniref:hypothetical protein n=1 Tax=Kitasatospora sp. NPDC093558 TaxID=3155201 RepID=UPI003432C802
MNNLDFSNQPLFSWYVVLLAISGIAMVITGIINVGGLKAGWRAVNIIFGLGFAGYAYYLGFVFEGGTYRIFFQAFILPVLLIANSVKAMANRGATPAAAQPAQPADPAAYDPNAPYNPNAQPVQSSPVAPPAQPAPAPQPSQPVADNPYARPQQPPQAG